MYNVVLSPLTTSSNSASYVDVDTRVCLREKELNKFFPSSTKVEPVLLLSLRSPNDASVYVCNELSTFGHWMGWKVRT